MDHNITSPVPDPLAFVGIRKVCELSGFSKATLLRMQKLGKFPLPVIREKNTVRYALAEVLQWRQDHFSKRALRLAPNADHVTAAIDGSKAPLCPA